MSVRAIAIGLTALMWAVPVTAQERGTMEFGAFGSAAKFDDALSLRSGYGGGGRISMFLDPRWSVEFEKAEMRASRPAGLADVNVGILSSRLVLVGAGAGISTETNFLHSYGVDGLVGAKLAMTDNVALRVDGVWDWLANQDWKSYRSVRVGLSVSRHPFGRTRTVTVVTPAPPPVYVAHEDSVSASETLRLRNNDVALRSLRDSLAASPPPVAAAPRASSDRAIPIRKEQPPKP
jgi:hypothetical protein